jgi:hypothetical protein
VDVGFAGVVAAVAPPPPHAAMATGASASPAALARIAIGLEGLSMFTPLRREKESPDFCVVV